MSARYQPLVLLSHSAKVRAVAQTSAFNCNFQYPEMTQASHLADRYGTGHMEGSCPTGVAAGCPEASQMALDACV